MIPENLPVFNIDLDCDFESSDNVIPSFGKNSQSQKNPQELTFLQQNETTTIFSHIGERKDNLDRCVVMHRPDFSLLALFDGHCDPGPVDYLQSELPLRLARHSQVTSNPEKALSEVFEECEQQVIEKFDKGSTALVVLIHKGQLWVANLGDSKLMGVDSKGNLKDFTVCHNLNNGSEMKAVIDRGGLVLKRGSQYRINGQLNLSRCFGDRHLKYCLSSKPDIYRLSGGQCKRWVLASDGFYNAENMEQRVKVVNFQELLEKKTVYKDNASAIFLDL